MKTDLLICECKSAEHQLLIRYFEDDLGSDVYLEPHLVTHNNFFKRIVVAFKYIFGFKSKYGTWDEMVVNKYNYQPLKNIIEFIENGKN